MAIVDDAVSARGRAVGNPPRVSQPLAVRNSEQQPLRLSTRVTRYRDDESGRGVESSRREAERDANRGDPRVRYWSRALRPGSIPNAAAEVCGCVSQTKSADADRRTHHEHTEELPTRMTIRSEERHALDHSPSRVSRVLAAGKNGGAGLGAISTLRHRCAC